MLIIPLETAFGLFISIGFVVFVLGDFHRVILDGSAFSVL